MTVTVVLIDPATANQSATQALTHHAGSLIGGSQTAWLTGTSSRPCRRPQGRPALGAANTTIPVLRIFSVDAALLFSVDFLGFRLDFGGPAGGPGTAYDGQVSRAVTTLHLTEVQDDPGPGATILIWIEGIVGLREELNARREQVRVWGPAVWAPEIEDAPWGARVLTIADPSGNHLRFNEPDDPALKAGLPRWGPEIPAG